jgi:hypothetical protein
MYTIDNSGVRRVSVFSHGSDRRPEEEGDRQQEEGQHAESHRQVGEGDPGVVQVLLVLKYK